VPLDIVTLVVASMVTFTATSMDNLLLLVGFRSSESIRPGVIGLAYVVTVIVVTGLALALAAVVDDVMPFPLGYLGFAPIGIGLWHGIRAFRSEPEPPEGTDSPEGARRDDAAGFVSVFLTMLANSGDSFLVFTAFLGDTRSWLDWVTATTFVAMAVLWARLSIMLSEHPRLRDPLRGFARFGLPILLICVGLYILLDSPTDAVVGP
jgi:cadmium resistance protein CadD (predicted permease)